MVERLGFEVVDGGERVLVEDAAEVAIYSAGESGAFVDQGGVYLDGVGTAFKGFDYVYGGGDAATGVDSHGFTNFPSNVGDDAEGVGKEGLAAEAATAHLDGGFVHGAGVGGGDAVDAQFTGDADKGEDVCLFLGVVVGRNFDEEGSGAVTVDAFEKLPEGGWVMEHAEAGGVWGADVELNALGQGSSPAVALAEFIDGEAGDAENEGSYGLLSEIGFDDVDAEAGEAEGIDEGLLSGSSEEAGSGVAGAGVEGDGAADGVAEAEIHEGVEVGAVFVGACGYAQGVWDGDAGQGGAQGMVAGVVEGGEELPEELSA